MKYVVEFSKIITAPVMGLLGVWLGSHLNFSNNTKIQKEFTIRKIRIEKIQEVNTDLMEQLREVSIVLVNITKYLKEEITLEQFIEQNSMQQDKIIALRRKLVVNQVFYKDCQSEIDILHNIFLQFSDKIYEAYVNPNTPNRIYQNDEITFDAIEKDILECQILGTDILKKQNEKLEKELKDLE